MSYSNLSAVTVTAAGQAIEGRTRVAAIYYTCTDTASSLDLINGSTDEGPVVVSLNTPAADGAVDVILPDMGVLFENGVYVDLADANVLSVTLFFYGGAAYVAPAP